MKANVSMEKGPTISSLMFVDDLLLFLEASIEQMLAINGVLDNFYATSGRKISIAKTMVFFSRNV